MYAAEVAVLLSLKLLTLELELAVRRDWPRVLEGRVRCGLWMPVELMAAGMIGPLE